MRMPPDALGLNRRFHVLITLRCEAEYGINKFIYLVEEEQMYLLQV